MAEREEMRWEGGKGAESPAGREQRKTAARRPEPERDADAGEKGDEDWFLPSPLLPSSPAVRDAGRDSPRYDDVRGGGQGEGGGQ